MTPEGTFVDDLLVYRLAPSHFLLVVNASHIAEDYKYIAEQIAAAGNVVAVDASARYALLAVQGPRALDVLQPLTGVELASMKYYWFAQRGSGERACHGVPNGLHRRGRLRDLRACHNRPIVSGRR